MTNMENLNILITGASGGIGTSLSKAFALTKANLFLLDLLKRKYPSYETNCQIERILTILPLI